MTHRYQAFMKHKSAAVGSGSNTMIEDEEKVGAKAYREIKEGKVNSR
jgi:hypothetical protein